jgi:Transposase
MHCGSRSSRLSPHDAACSSRAPSVARGDPRPGRTRRRFTAAFKAQAVERLLEGSRGLSEVATELGLSPGQPGAWRNEHLAAGSAEGIHPAGAALRGDGDLGGAPLRLV